MSATVDERIVQMTFDNEQFEEGIAKSIQSLAKFSENLDLDDAVGKAGSALSQITKSTNIVENAFTSLEGVLKRKILDRIADKLIDTGTQLAKTLSIDQITSGFAKYADMTKSTRTIVNAIKNDYSSEEEALEATVETLEKLNKYTDETSYSFTEMVSSIGKFTSNGIKLEKAEIAMEGIGNWAAKSGQGIQQANAAMYNIAQALSTGSLKLMDWKSIENANMATKEAKETFIECAVAAGKLKRGTDGIARTAKGTKVDIASFSDTLKEEWLTTEVLIAALTMYSDTTTEFGEDAYKAAQQAYTYQDAMDAVKDAVSSSWMNTMSYIFGDVDQAAELWTNFCNGIIEAIQPVLDRINEMFSLWNQLGGREDAINGLGEAFWAIVDALTAIGSGFEAAFGSITYKNLIALSDKVRELGDYLAEIFWIKHQYIDHRTHHLETTVEQKVKYTGEEIKKGQKDKDGENSVKEIQQALTDAGYGDLLGSSGIDGIFGSNTEKALKKFQKDMGLTVTGVLDEATANAFGETSSTHNVIETVTEDIVTMSDACQTLYKIFEGVGTFFKSFMEWLMYKIQTAIVIIDTISPLILMILKILGNIGHILNVIFGNEKKGKKFGQSTYEAVKKYLGPVKDFFDRISNTVLNFFGLGDEESEGASKFEQAVETIKTNVKECWNVISGWLKPAIDVIKDFFGIGTEGTEKKKPIWTRIKEWLFGYNEIETDYDKDTGEKFSHVEHTLGLIEKVSNYISEKWENVKTTLLNLIDDDTTLGKIIGKISRFFFTHEETVVEYDDKTGDTIEKTQTVLGFFEKAGNWISDKWDSITKIFDGLSLNGKSPAQILESIRKWFFGYDSTIQIPTGNGSTTSQIVHVQGFLEKLHDWLVEKKEWLLDKLQPALDWISDFWNSTIKEKWENFKRWFFGYDSTIQIPTGNGSTTSQTVHSQGAIEKVYDWLVEKKEWLLEKLQPALDWISDFWNSSIKEKWENFKKWFFGYDSTIQMPTGNGSTTSQTAHNQGVIEIVYDWLVEKKEWLLDKLQPALDWISDFWNSTIKEKWENFKRWFFGYDSTIQIPTGNGSTTSQTVHSQGAIEKVYDWLVEKKEWLLEKLQPALDWISDFWNSSIKEKWENFKKWFFGYDSTIQIPTGNGSTTSQTVHNQGIIERIKGWTDNLNILETLKKVWESIKGFLDKLTGDSKKTNKWGKALKTVLGFLAGFLLLKTIVSIFSLTKEIKESSSAGFSGNFGLTVLMLAGGILIIAKAIMMLSEIESSKLIKGAATVSIIVAVLSVFIIATTKFANVEAEKGSMASLGLSVLSIAAALLIISASIYLLGNMDMKKLLKGSTAIVLIMGLLFGMMTLFGRLGKTNGIFVVKGLIPIVGAVALIALLAIMLSVIDFWSFAKGLIMISMIMGLIVVFMRGLSKITKIGRLTTSLATLGGLALVIGVLAGIAWLLGKTDFGQMLKGIVLVTVILGVLALFLYAVSKIDSIKVNFMPLIGITLAIAMISVIAFLLGQMETKDIAKGLIAIVTIMGAISLFLFVLGKINSTGIAMSGMFSIIAVCLLLVTFIVVTKQLKNIDGETIIKAIVSIGAVMLAINLFLKILSKTSLTMNIQSAISSLIMIGGLVVLIAAFVGALKLLQGINDNTILTFAISIATLFGGLALALYALSMIPGGSVAMIKGALGLSAAIAIIVVCLGALVALIGLIDDISGGAISDKLKKGAEMMQIIGSAIGGMIGSIKDAMYSSNGLNSLTDNIFATAISILSPLIATAGTLSTSIISSLGYFSELDDGHFQEDLEKGSEYLGIVGSAIGTFISNLKDGFFSDYGNNEQMNKFLAIGDTAFMVLTLFSKWWTSDFSKLAFVGLALIAFSESLSEILGKIIDKDPNKVMEEGAQYLSLIGEAIGSFIKGIKGGIFEELGDDFKTNVLQTAIGAIFSVLIVLSGLPAFKKGIFNTEAAVAGAAALMMLFGGLDEFAKLNGLEETPVLSSITKGAEMLSKVGEGIGSLITGLKDGIFGKLDSTDFKTNLLSAGIGVIFAVLIAVSSIPSLHFNKFLMNIGGVVIAIEAMMGLFGALGDLGEEDYSALLAFAPESIQKGALMLGKVGEGIGTLISGIKDGIFGKMDSESLSTNILSAGVGIIFSVLFALSGLKTFRTAKSVIEISGIVASIQFVMGLFGALGDLGERESNVLLNAFTPESIAKGALMLGKVGEGIGEFVKNIKTATFGDFDSKNISASVFGTATGIIFSVLTALSVLMISKIGFVKSIKVALIVSSIELLMGVFGALDTIGKSIGLGDTIATDSIENGAKILGIVGNGIGSFVGGIKGGFFSDSTGNIGSDIISSATNTIFTVLTWMATFGGGKSIKNLATGAALVAGATVFIGLVGYLEELSLQKELLGKDLKGILQTGGEILCEIGNAIGAFIGGFKTAAFGDIIGNTGSDVSNVIASIGSILSVVLPIFLGMGPEIGIAGGITGAITLFIGCVEDLLDRLGSGGMTSRLSKGGEVFREIGKALGSFVGGFKEGMETFSFTDLIEIAGDMTEEEVSELSEKVGNLSQIFTDLGIFMEALDKLDIQNNAGKIAAWFKDQTTIQTFFNDVDMMFGIVTGHFKSLDEFDTSSLSTKIRNTVAAFEAVRDFILTLNANDFKDTFFEDFYEDGHGNDDVLDYLEKVLERLITTITELNDVEGFEDLNTKKFEEFGVGLNNLLSGISQMIPMTSDQLSNVDTKAIAKTLNDLALDIELSKPSDDAMATLEKLSSSAFNLAYAMKTLSKVNVSDIDSSEISSKVTELTSNISSSISNSNIDVSKFQGLTTDIYNAMNGNTSIFSSVGLHIVQGLEKGMADNAYMAYARARYLANKIKSIIDEVFNAHSPSREMIKRGMWIDQGLAIGLTKYSNIATSSAEDMSESVLSATSETIGKISDIITSDVDTDPVIRPVMDLSNITSGAETIGSMLSGTRTIGVNAESTAKLASSMPISNKVNQNGIIKSNPDSAGSNTSSLNLTGNNFYIRSEQDIHNLAHELASLSMQQQRSLGMSI